MTLDSVSRKKRSRTAGMRLIVCIALFLGSSPVLCDEGTAEIPLSLRAESFILVEGNSSLHEYESKNTEMTASAVVTAVKPLNPSESPLAALVGSARTYAPRVSRLRLDIPVVKFKSPVLGLDGNFHKTLKGKEFPEISFRLVSSPEAVVVAADRLLVKATGDLTIAGKTRKVDLETEVTLNGKTVVVKGKKQLLMSEYGIKPPTMLAGKIVVEDKVTVIWRLVFAADAVKKAP